MLGRLVGFIMLSSSSAETFSSGNALTSTLYEEASLASPLQTSFMGIVKKPDENVLYVGMKEFFHGIGKLNMTNNTFSVVAGTSNTGFVDGPLANSRFEDFEDMAFDGSNVLYVFHATGSDSGFRKVDLSSGQVTTLSNTARGMVDGALGSVAQMEYVTSLEYHAISGFEFIYFGDRSLAFTWSRVRKIDLTSQAVTTVVGSTTGGTIDGSFAVAGFHTISGISFGDVDGNIIYAVDPSVTSTMAIRRVDVQAQAVTSIIGGVISATPIDGPFSSALFGLPKGIISIPSRNVSYVATNRGVRAVDFDSGVVTSIVREGQENIRDGIGLNASFKYVQSMTYDPLTPTPVLYVTQVKPVPAIRRIEDITTVTPTASPSTQGPTTLSPSTVSPTYSPTQSPTLSPTTDSPTASPVTGSPTSAPTTPVPPPAAASLPMEILAGVIFGIFAVFVGACIMYCNKRLERRRKEHEQRLEEICRLRLSVSGPGRSMSRGRKGSRRDRYRSRTRSRTRSRSRSRSRSRAASNERERKQDDDEVSIDFMTESTRTEATRSFRTRSSNPVDSTSQLEMTDMSTSLSGIDARATSQDNLS